MECWLWRRSPRYAGRISEADQGYLPGPAYISEGRPEGDLVQRDRVSLRAGPCRLGIVTLAKNTRILEGSSTTLELSKPLIFQSAADDRFARLTSKSRQRDNALREDLRPQPAALRPAQAQSAAQKLVPFPPIVADSPEFAIACERKIPARDGTRPAVGSASSANLAPLRHLSHHETVGSLDWITAGTCRFTKSETVP